jgi:ABC-type lipoprotein export system ATPase subunit
MKNKRIECSDIVKVYTEGTVSVPALRGANHSFENGKIYVIFGPSGSGKTTFLSILGGMLTPTSGEVNFYDMFTIDSNTEDLFDFRINNISFIFQQPIFIPFLNVADNILFVSQKTSNTPSKNKKDALNSIDTILSRMGLDHRKDSFPYQLSGGERQRLSMAIALHLDNPVWLCDEPTGTLDSENRKIVMDLLKEIISEDPSKYMIIVTHDPNFQAIADEILLLKDGVFDVKLSKEEFEKFNKGILEFESSEKDIEKGIKKKRMLKKIEEIKKELLES